MRSKKGFPKQKNTLYPINYLARILLNEGNSEMTEPVILVVDDSRVSRMLIRTIIAHAHPKATIIEAGNAEEALAKVENQLSITTATLDLNMPGMDGLTLASKLLERFPHARFGLLTANIQEAVKNKAENLGILFISKPITEEKILAFIDG